MPSPPATAGETLPLTEARQLLRAGLSHRSEPVLVVGDQFVPAVSLWAGALQRERTGRGHRSDAVVPLVTSDIERVYAAIAAVWRGDLKLPRSDRPSPRRAALVTA